MTNDEFIAVNGLIEKYESALSICLYPSQVALLRECLNDWINEKEIIEIDDSFTRLAFMMIISAELHDQAHKEGVQK